MKLCLNCNAEYGDERQVCPKDGSTLVQKTSDPLLGTTVAEKYRVDGLLGKGAMGAVYKVTKLQGGDECALKVLHSFLGDDNESVIRFHREAKATSKLNHPNVVQVFDFGVMPGGQPFLVMELLRGVPLEKVLTDKGNMTVAEVAPVLKQVCEAIQHAHEQGIIHRDIKPDNVVLDAHAGRGGNVKVVDFGIAKMAQSPDETPVKLTRTGMICGSPAYISPEQIQGQAVDARGDVYSLGVLLYEMLTGRVPFMAADLVKLLFMHVTESPPTLKQARPDLSFPNEVERVVGRALAKSPDERQQSALQLWLEFEAALLEADSNEFRPSAPAPGAVDAGLPAASDPGRHKAATAAGPAGTAAGPADRAPQQAPDLAITAPLEPISYAWQPVPRRTGEHGRVQAEVSRPFRTGGQKTGMSLSLNFLFGLGLVVAVVAAIVARPWAVEKTDPRSLLGDGRVEEALLQLTRKKQGGKWSKSEAELLERCYLTLAKKKAGQHLYASAIELLRQIPPGSQHAAEARALIRQYKRSRPQS